MIQQLNFLNFQGFKGTQSAVIRPITLIFGPNSSGKSSIGRSIQLMAEEFVRSVPRDMSELEWRESSFLELGFSKAGLRTAKETIYGQLKNPETELDHVLGYGWTGQIDEELGIRGVSDVTGMVTHQFVLDHYEIMYDHTKSVQAIIHFDEELVDAVADTYPDLQIPLTVTIVVDAEGARFKDLELPELAILEAFFAVNGRWRGYPRKGPSQIPTGTFREILADEMAKTEALLETFEIQDQGNYSLLEHTHEFWYAPIQICPPYILGSHILWGDVEVEYLDHDARAGDAFWPERIESSGLDKASSERLALLADLFEVAYGCVIPVLRGLVKVPSLREIPKAAAIVESNAKPKGVVERMRTHDPILKAVIDGAFERNSPKTALSKLTGGRYSLDMRTEDIEGSGIKIQLNQLIDTHNGSQLTFQEVGTGISQVYPVIEAIYNARFVYVEQPELHLHPRMQGQLMDLIIDRWIENPDSQFILETHSESMLLRLQKRIRNGDISADLVSIIYVDSVEDFGDDSLPVDSKTSSGKQYWNVISEISLDNYGDVIDPFPESFASLRLEDLL